MQDLIENLAQLREKLPKRVGFAKLVAQRLHKKGVEVSTQQVYRAVSGKYFHEVIIDEFISLAEEFKQREQELTEKSRAIIDNASKR